MEAVAASSPSRPTLRDSDSSSSTPDAQTCAPSDFRRKSAPHRLTPQLPLRRPVSDSSHKSTKVVSAPGGVPRIVKVKDQRFRDQASDSSQKSEKAVKGFKVKRTRSDRTSPRARSSKRSRKHSRKRRGRSTSPFRQRRPRSSPPGELVREPPIASLPSTESRVTKNKRFISEHKAESVFQNKNLPLPACPFPIDQTDYQTTAVSSATGYQVTQSVCNTADRLIGAASSSSAARQTVKVVPKEK